MSENYRGDFFDLHCSLHVLLCLCSCGDVVNCWFILLSGSVIIDQLMLTARHSSVSSPIRRHSFIFLFFLGGGRLVGGGVA